MDFVRIKTYFSDSGEFTTCEHVYMAKSHVEALDRFKKDYPSHSDFRTIRVAETVHEDMDNPSEWFKAVMACGCLHL